MPKWGMGFRPKPTGPVINYATGGDASLLESIHHGLEDCTLINVYPAISLDTALAFAVGSFELRKDPEYRERITSMGLREIFEHTISQEIRKQEFFKVRGQWEAKPISYKNALVWLRGSSKHKQGMDFKQDHANAWIKMNCMHGLSHLDSLEDSVGDSLKGQLKKPRSEYVFECQYDDRRQQRLRDHPEFDINRLRNMEFQNYKPKKGTIVPNYIKRIVGLLKNYPTEYGKDFNKPVEEVVDEPPRTAGGQGLLWDVAPEPPFFDH